MSATDAVERHLAQRPAAEILYTDLDGTLLGPGGSLLTAADGRPSFRAAEALVRAAAAGVTVVPVSGRALGPLRDDVRLLGLGDCIAEAGAIVVRDDEVRDEWGECPRDLAGNPHDAMVAAGALDALLRAFSGDLRHYEPWHLGRRGGHLFHGLVDVDRAADTLAAAGCGWARLVDNGPTGGWHGRSVRAYHLLPRGVGKAVAVSDDLRARNIAPERAVAVGDSLEDLTMAASVGTFVLVANAGADVGHATLRVPGAMGDGFADVVSAMLSAHNRPADASPGEGRTG